jgi:hypothetical protein
VPAKTDTEHGTSPLLSDQFGVPLETTLERRERFANRYDYEFGQERVFPELVEALMDQVPEGSKVLEAGAATGLLTEPLLERAGHLTALEPSEGMLRRLLAKDVADSPCLRVMRGMAEDLARNELFEYAVVTFTPRRGVGLLRLLQELAFRVTTAVIMLLDDDPSMDWAFLARAAAWQGFDVTLHFVAEKGVADPSQARHAVLLVADVTDWTPSLPGEAAWEFEARTVDVPYPAPRGAATRLVRYFLAGGDRAMLVRTQRDGLDRLYGNLRTAVHRLGRDEVTVRRTDEGVQIVRLPKPIE